MPYKEFPKTLYKPRFGSDWGDDKHDIIIVNNQDQEEEYLSRGYILPGVADANAFTRAGRDLELRKYIEYANLAIQERNKAKLSYKRDVDVLRLSVDILKREVSSLEAMLAAKNRLITRRKAVKKKKSAIKRKK